MLYGFVQNKHYINHMAFRESEREREREILNETEQLNLPCKHKIKILPTCYTTVIKLPALHNNGYSGEHLNTQV